ncbi:MAG: hypothetical protein ACRD26_19330, partial [Vicinamibacterales bacterium]
MRLRRVLAIGAMLVAVAALGVASFVTAAPAQDDPTDARLETASGARSVRVRLGGAAGGRVVELPLEVYVARVLAGEGEPRAGTAAQQALAIA